MILRRKKRHLGPHVIEPTGERMSVGVTQVSYTNKDSISGRRWECKYCDWSGLHPSKSFVNNKFKRPCDGVEWLDSELEDFEAEYESHRSDQ